MAPEFRAGRMAEVDKGVRAQWAQSTMVGQFLVCKGAHATEDAGTFEIYGDKDQAKARATELSQDPSSATPAHVACARSATFRSSASKSSPRATGSCGMARRRRGASTERSLPT